MSKILKVSILLISLLFVTGGYLFANEIEEERAKLEAELVELEEKLLKYKGIMLCKTYVQFPQVAASNTCLT